jgi:hypothetical protein
MPGLCRRPCRRAAFEQKKWRRTRGDAGEKDETVSAVLIVRTGSDTPMFLFTICDLRFRIYRLGMAICAPMAMMDRKS